MKRVFPNSLVLLVALIPVIAWGSDWPTSRHLNNLKRVSVSENLIRSPFTGWEVFANDIFDCPVLAYGAPVYAGQDANEALQTVLRAAACQNDFRNISSHSFKNFTRSFFREYRNGKPVIGGRVDLVFSNDGKLSRWSLRSHDHWPTVDYHSLEMTTAAEALTSVCEPADWRADTEKCHEAWFPDVDRRILRPVWWIRIYGDRPDQRWEGLVDALSGAIIYHWPGIHTDVVSGVVSGPYWPEFLRDQPQLGVHQFENVTINGNTILTNTNGLFSREAGTTAYLVARLRGSYVWVQNDAGQSGMLSQTVTAPFAPLTWNWTVNDATPPELNLYYHTTFIHQWYKVLDPDFDALDYSVPAVANYGINYDNAFWNGYGTYYGGGQEYSNFAMFSDIIYHEYTHGVTHGIYENYYLPYIGESGALNEAWSDYFSCTINDDPYEAEYIMLNMFGSFFRNLDNDLVFPDDWYGEVHFDSRFVSGALWDIREALGSGIADSLAHYSRYAHTDNFLDYFFAVLETDDDDHNLMNGTPHNSTIFHAFGRHGIGPGNVPQMEIQNLAYYADGTGGSSGDGDRYYERGETIELQFTLSNNSMAIQPPASGIQIAVLVNDTVMTVQNGVQVLDELPAGQAHTIIPVRISVRQDSPDYWAIVKIVVTANGGEFQLSRSIEFMIGVPRILIVEDDPQTDVERFVSDALRARQRIYERIQVASAQSLPAELLPDTGVVIWLSGDESRTILTAQDRLLLQNYMAEGNRVVLSGQYFKNTLAGTSFAGDILHIDVDTGSVFSSFVSANASPLIPNELFLIRGGNGAGNQRQMTVIIPQGTSREIARYNHDGDGAVAAVECADGKCLLFGFGIEAISGTGTTEFTDLPTFFDRIYGWAEGILSSTPLPPRLVTPTEWSIGPAFPNPFNGSTMISYSIPAGFSGELIVYDLLGRTVDHVVLTQSVGHVAWRPQAASGIYFAQARWKDGQTQPIRLLLLK